MNWNTDLNIVPYLFLAPPHRNCHLHNESLLAFYNGRSLTVSGSAGPSQESESPYNTWAILLILRGSLAIFSHKET
jgi:hypothetical protein